MRFTPQILDEIRARLNVSDVVGRTVALKKKGREFAGLSPFKSEKTASFFVNDQKGFYHCFASGEHGDIFTFLMKTQGLSFPEAVERLAEEAGVELPKERPVDRQRVDERDRLLDVLEQATAYFQAQLTTSAARHAREYVTRRGLNRQTIADFRIGYAPAGFDALSSHLRQKGFSDNDIVRAGMRIAGPDISRPYDRFRDRIMFPIADGRGRIVAFGGRALDPGQSAKYLNSPETPVFHKGHLLYNADRARQAAHKSERLIVVEGYMDVIALAQAGFAEAVAPLGTALTPEQIQLLWRMCPEPILCFDGDSAGKRAAHRAVDTVLPLLKPGHSLHFSFLPAGADPDDFVRQQGSEAFQSYLARAQPLADTLWEREWDSGSWDTPERRAKLEDQLRKLVSGIADPAVRNHYGRIIWEKLKEAWQASRTTSGSIATQKPGNRLKFSRSPQRRGGLLPDQILHSPSLKSSTLAAPGDTAHQYREALLLRTLINHPWFIEEVAEEIAELEFKNMAFAALRDALLSACAEEINLDTAALRNHLDNSGFAPNLEQIERVTTNKCHVFAEPDADRVEVEDGWRHTLSLHQQQLLRDQLVEAEREYRHNLDEDALARILELQRLIANIVQKPAAFE